jgi:hypothetical protein
MAEVGGLANNICGTGCGEVLFDLNFIGNLGLGFGLNLGLDFAVII